MQWGEGCRHCDLVLGYHRPSGSKWERGSSASRLQLSAGNWATESETGVRVDCCLSSTPPASFSPSLSPYFENVTNHWLSWVYWIMLAKIPARRNTHRPSPFDINNGNSKKSSRHVSIIFWFMSEISERAPSFCCHALQNSGSTLSRVARVIRRSWILESLLIPQKVGQSWALLTRALQGSFPSVQMWACN